jgi:hypothetical protein
MKTLRRWQCWCMLGLGLSLTTLTGCQTNVAGMTLPTGHYLEHPPQYFPPSPPYPLTRELASMEAAAVGATVGGAAPVPGPQVLPAPGPAPAPVPAPPPPMPGQ